jgi:hypothetical protein
MVKHELVILTLRLSWIFSVFPPTKVYFVRIWSQVAPTSNFCFHNQCGTITVAWRSRTFSETIGDGESVG